MYGLHEPPLLYFGTPNILIFSIKVKVGDKKGFFKS